MIQGGVLDVKDSGSGATFPSDAADLQSLPRFWTDFLKTYAPGTLRVNAVPSPPPPQTGDLLGDASGKELDQSLKGFMHCIRQSYSNKFRDRFSSISAFKWAQRLAYKLVEAAC